ncbi:MAG: hypothetical protein LBM08_07780 [Dysgonamonadaceae bacterium]|jgi:hypothetical protein|nr:hypothetical protein [Dysgonamonadaceae bacterium]
MTICGILLYRLTGQCFLVCVILLFSGITCGQDINDKRHNISIYEHGTPLTSCECNFENLFRNWSIWIRNAQETELLSFNYVETLEDSMRIAYYAGLMNIRIIERRGVNGFDSVAHWMEWSFRPKPWKQYADSITASINDADMKKRFYSDMKNNRKYMEKRFKTAVQTGDKVYLIKTRTHGIEYDDYVVCRPDTYKIIWDQLFLEIQKPVNK